MTTLTSKITAACAFDEGAVADAWQNSPASDYSLDYELGARFQHAKDQRIIVALAAQLESVVGAMEEAQTLLLKWAPMHSEMVLHQALADTEAALSRLAGSDHD